MSFRFRSTAWSVSLPHCEGRTSRSSICGIPRRIHHGSQVGPPCAELLLVGWRSQLSAVGFVVGLLLDARDTTPKQDCHDSPDMGRLLSCQHKTLMEVVRDGYSA